MTTREPLPDDDVCRECGCDRVHYSAWIVVNTDEITGNEGPVSYYYCPDCDTEIYRLVSREDYNRRTQE